MASPRIVIDDGQTQRRWPRWFMLGGALIVVGILLWGGYGVALSVAGGDWSDMRQRANRLTAERDALQGSLDSLTQENQRLREELTFAERSAEIDQMACSTVRASLKELEQEQAELREQVAFYRGIVSPDEARAGLRLHEVVVRPLAASRNYSLALTLVQSVRSNRDVSGQLSIWIDGIQAEEPLRLDLNAIKSTESDQLKFSFKFFQDLAVDFTLPEAFVPTRLVIWADPQGANNRIERRFDWDEILRG